MFIASFWHITYDRTPSHATLINAKPSSHISHTSPVPMMSQLQQQQQQQQSAPLLSVQAQRLLEDCRNENRMLEETVGTLKEQVNMFEQEMEQQREQIRIKEANYEEEIQILKGQVRYSYSVTEKE